MKQNNLSNQLNHEFPMAQGYEAFEATADGGARFTNPMEYRERITYFKVYAEGKGFRVVEDGMDLFPKRFSNLEELCGCIGKIGRLERRKTPEQRIMAEIADVKEEIYKLNSQLADLQRELSFYQ